MPQGNRSRQVILGVSGASGAIFGVRLLQVLSSMEGVESHLVMSRAAGQTIAMETDWSPRDVREMADHVYKIDDIAASISSGSFPIDAMVIAPCSMRSVAAIAAGFDDNLLTRAAGVTLKERRPLIVCPRESPLHLGHLRSLVQLAEIGAVVAPLMPAFYARPQTVSDIIDHAVGRLLDLLGLPSDDSLVKRWQGPSGR